MQVSGGTTVHLDWRRRRCDVIDRRPLKGLAHPNIPVSILKQKAYVFEAVRKQRCDILVRMSKTGRIGGAMLEHRQLLAEAEVSRIWDLRNFEYLPPPDRPGNPVAIHTREVLAE